MSATSGSFPTPLGPGNRSSIASCYAGRDLQVEAEVTSFHPNGPPSVVEILLKGVGNVERQSAIIAISYRSSFRPVLPEGVEAATTLTPGRAQMLKKLLLDTAVLSPLLGPGSE